MRVGKKVIINTTVIIASVLFVWLKVGQVEGNLVDAFFSVFTSVYIYLIVFVSGLLYVLLCGKKDNQFCYFTNIRLDSKQNKIKRYMRDSLIISAGYTITFFIISFVALISIYGLDFSWSYQIENNIAEYLLYKNNISTYLAIGLVVLRFGILAAMISASIVLAEIAVGKYKVIVVFGLILAGCVLDFSHIPVLSLFYLGVNNDFLVSGSIENVVRGFVLDNLPIGIMVWIYYECSKKFAKRLDLTRV